MFHRVKTVTPLPKYRLSVQFSEGVTKIYDLAPLFEKIPIFNVLKEKKGLFEDVSVDVGGYGIVWNDEIDLSCDELWENGEEIKITDTEKHKKHNSFDKVIGDIQ